MDVDMFDVFEFEASVDQSAVFPEGIMIASFKELDDSAPIMSITSAIQYEIHASDDILSRVETNYPGKETYVKKMKDGSIKEIAAEEAVIGLKRINDCIEVMIPSSGGIKISDLVGQLAEVIDVHTFVRIVKTAQMRKSSEGNFEVIV